MRVNLYLIVAAGTLDREVRCALSRGKIKIRNHMWISDEALDEAGVACIPIDDGVVGKLAVLIDVPLGRLFEKVRDIMSYSTAPERNVDMKGYIRLLRQLVVDNDLLDELSEYAHRIGMKGEDKLPPPREDGPKMLSVDQGSVKGYLSRIIKDSTRG